MPNNPPLLNITSAKLTDQQHREAADNLFKHAMSFFQQELYSHAIQAFSHGLYHNTLIEDKKDSDNAAHADIVLWLGKANQTEREYQLNLLMQEYEKYKPLQNKTDADYNVSADILINIYHSLPAEIDVSIAEFIQGYECHIVKEENKLVKNKNLSEATYRYLMANYLLLGKVNCELNKVFDVRIETNYFSELLTIFLNKMGSSSNTLDYRIISECFKNMSASTAIGAMSTKQLYAYAANIFFYTFKIELEQINIESLKEHFSSLIKALPSIDRSFLEVVTQCIEKALQQKPAILNPAIINIILEHKKLLNDYIVQRKSHNSIDTSSPIVTTNEKHEESPNKMTSLSALGTIIASPIHGPTQPNTTNNEPNKSQQSMAGPSTRFGF